MVRSAVLKLLAGVTALALPLVALSMAAATQHPHGTPCSNIGDGNLCISVSNRNSNGNFDVTAWYTKNSGPGVYVDLAYGGDCPWTGVQFDQGAFWEYAGQNRGYTWHNQELGGGYCQAILFVHDPNDPHPSQGTEIDGGYVVPNY